MCKKSGLHLHIAMYPLFAMGHITPFLDLANKLAKAGHTISIFLPTKTRLKLTPHNHYANLITFIPISIPPVDGLPCGAETTHDIPASARPKLLHAMDLTRDIIDSQLSNLKPDIVLFDTLDWLPGLARKHGVKSVYYAVQTPAMFGYCSINARNLISDHHLVESDLTNPPPGFPTPEIRLRGHESRAIVRIFMGEVGNGLKFLQKHNIAIEQSDAILFKSCREMEGIYCDFVEKNFYNKPVFLAGPVVPKTPTTKLDEFFNNWLNNFSHGSVVYCALGSECVLQIDQFNELVLGLELTGKPFLAVLKPPVGYEKLETVLPEGFLERTKNRGIVYDGWVQQLLILKHLSVGCFVTHCGPGSLSEGLISECQLVLMPQAVDQFVNARVMSLELRVGVEVEKRGEEDGFVSREAVQKAVSVVMDDGSEVGKEVRENHAKWRNFLFQEHLEESYVSLFVQNLKDLIG
ncbi:hypothetical protein RND81_08G116300 [Saponaria officinalis]|uniref:Glycosyltransferase n=1 Tax=Saponaria officinalis TaxID=3572 RepID=A0AAW1J7Z3_SAPOF